MAARLLKRRDTLVAVLAMAVMVAARLLAAPLQAFAAGAKAATDWSSQAARSLHHVHLFPVMAAAAVQAAFPPRHNRHR